MHKRQKIYNFKILFFSIDQEQFVELAIKFSIAFMASDICSFRLFSKPKIDSTKFPNKYVSLLKMQADKDNGNFKSYFKDLALLSSSI